jgi:hypothetical protein
MNKRSSNTIEAEATFAADLYRDRAAITLKVAVGLHLELRSS